MKNITTQYHDLPVLITGGCGFIGSHLAYLLVQAGAHVTILDNLSTGSLEAIGAIKDKINFIHADIRDADACLYATRNQATIFHLAAFISVPDSYLRPFDCLDTNITGTVQLLEAARKNAVKRFIFSSSAAVYGQQAYALKEDDACHPSSPYGYSKLIGELLCRQYSEVYNIMTVILRYFNVWGEQQNPQSPYAGVMARFLHNMRNNLPITIYGDGKQTRDFIHVNDVAQANARAGMWPEEISGQVFNIATGNSQSLIEVATQLRDQFPAYTGSLRFEPARAVDITYSAADCSKYKQFVQNSSKGP